MKVGWGVGGGDSNCKYGCGILAKIVNMDVKFITIRLKNIDWVLNLTKIVSIGLKVAHPYQKSWMLPLTQYRRVHKAYAQSNQSLRCALIR